MNLRDQMDSASVLVPHSYDIIQREIGKGQGSIARIQTAASLIEQGIAPDTSIVLYPQGWPAPRLRRWLGRADPTKPPSGNYAIESLGENLARYTKSLRAMNKAQIYFEPLGWTTIDDTVNSYRMIAQLGYRTAHFRFVSDSAHLMRVKQVVRSTLPVGWTAEFFEAGNHQLSGYERAFREVIGRCAYRMLLLPYYIKRPLLEDLWLKECPNCHRPSLKTEATIEDRTRSMLHRPLKVTVHRSYCWVCKYHKETTVPL